MQHLSKRYAIKIRSRYFCGDDGTLHWKLFDEAVDLRLYSKEDAELIAQKALGKGSVIEYLSDQQLEELVLIRLRGKSTVI